MMDTRCMDLPAEGRWTYLPAPALCRWLRQGCCCSCCTQGTCKMHVSSPMVLTAPQQGWATSLPKNGVCAHCPLFHHDPHVTLGTGGSWSLLQTKQESSSHRSACLLPESIILSLDTEVLDTEVLSGRGLQGWVVGLTQVPEDSLAWPCVVGQEWTSPSIPGTFSQLAPAAQPGSVLTQGLGEGSQEPKPSQSPEQAPESTS